MKTIKIRFWNGNKMLYKDLFSITKDISYIGEPMLFTGLLDKKGREIYEGDYISTADIDVALVRYSTDTCTYEIIDVNNGAYLGSLASCAKKYTKIIDNITKQPEEQDEKVLNKLLKLLNNKIRV